MSTQSTPRCRPPKDQEASARAARLRALDKALIACYEIIDMIRDEKREIDAAIAASKPEAAS